MSKFTLKLGRRIMAAALSLALAMSGMPLSDMPVYADELWAAESAAAEADAVEADADEVLQEEEAVADKDMEKGADAEKDAAASEVKADQADAADDKTVTADTQQTEEENVSDKDNKAQDEGQASETGSSLNGENEGKASEDEASEMDDAGEKAQADENVRGTELQTMTFNETTSSYTLNAKDITAFVKGANTGKEVLLGDNYFALICSANTVVDSSKQTFYDFDSTQTTNNVGSEQITQRIAMGGNATKTQAIKFITNASADVTVYWCAKDGGGPEVILNDSEAKVTETDESPVKSGLYKSVMTLNEAGTYYLGGNNYIYKVVVSAAKEKVTYTDEKKYKWDFSTNQVTVGENDQKKADLVTMSSETDTANKGAITKCTLEYFGLKVDANNRGTASNGKFQKRGSDIWLNANTTVRVPLIGKSKVTLVASSGAGYALYSVDGTPASTNVDTTEFICSGENGYAEIIATGQAYIKSITVTPIETVAVSGTVTATPEISDSYQVIFTDKNDSTFTVAANVTSGNYTAKLPVGTYSVKLSDDTYAVTEPAGDITVASGAAQTVNITASKQMDITNVTGSITMPAGKTFGLTFKSTDNEHTPDVSITGNTYSVPLKTGKTYNITATGTGIKDYDVSPKTLTADAASKDITFTEKTKYPVTLTVSGKDVKGNDITENILKTAGARLVFTNKSDNKTDDKYEYAFKVGDEIKLREGTYSVKTENSANITDKTKGINDLGAGADKSAYIAASPISDLTVGTSSNSLAVEYKYASEWDFTSTEFKNVMTAEQSIFYNGLFIKYAKMNGTKLYVYSYPQYSTIRIPVKGDCRVTLETDTLADTKALKEVSGGTGKEVVINNSNGKYIYDYTGTEGAVTVGITSSNHDGGNISKITVTYPNKINITTASIANGTVTAKASGKTEALPGETVKLSDAAEAVPAENCALDAWSIKYTDGDGAEQTADVSGDASSGYTFVMPAYDVTISAAFKQLGPTKYALTLANDVDAAQGIVTKDGITDPITQASAGQSIDMAQVAKAQGKEGTGYELDYWYVTYKAEGAATESTQKVTKNAEGKYTFAMPAAAVTIKPVFVMLYTIQVAADVTNGTVTAKPGAVLKAKAAEKVLLKNIVTAEPNPCYALKSWKVTYKKDGADTDVTVSKEGADYCFNMPQGNVTVSAVFEEETVEAKLYNFKDDAYYNNGRDTTVEATPGFIFDENVKYFDGGNSHGLWTKADNATIKLNLSGAATITVTSCQYNQDGKKTGKIIVNDETTPVEPSKDADPVFTIKAAEAGMLTLKFTENKTYIHSIKVEYKVEEPAIPGGEEADEKNNFKVWLDELADENGTVAAKAYEYQGGTVTLNNGKDAAQFTKFSSAANVERDGEIRNGYKAGGRYAVGSYTANDIPSVPKAGEGCCVIFEPKATGMFKIYFWSTSFLRVWDFETASGTRKGYTDSGTAADFYAFNAVPGHTYVMSTTGATNNMAYIGYQFIQDMDIDVETAFNNVDAEAGALEKLEIELTDAALGTKKAVVKKDTATVKLLKNHTYKITSNDGSVKAEVGGKDTFTADGSKITFDLYNVASETLTGEITGTPAGTVTSLKFVNMVNGSEFTAEITGMTYTCSMKPGEYNTVVETTNGGKTYDRVSVKPGAENVNEVYVEVPDPSKARTYAPADIVELEQTGLTLRSDNGGDVTGNSGATVKVPVAGKAAVTIETYYQASYTVNGTEYTNTTNSTTANQQDKMTVEGDFTISVTGTTYLRKISVSPVTEFKSELNVPGDYDTLNEAFAAIASMENRPEGEAGRVTVNLNKDIREQTVLNAPYVTLKGNGHTVDWYYGVGTLYYSVDPSTGLYNERLARDKYSSAEGNGNLWGGVFIVRGSNFIAEDTTFKNTYNYELTDEENTDIAGSTLSVSRLAEGADVTAYEYKERSNAFYIEADNIECYNCKILSSQDTLGRNGSQNNGYHVYFKDCVIGGNVDYICGEFAAVFDNCELQWKTFSNKGNEKVGYIVAPKTNPNVFRNCTVTIDKKDAQGVLGYYGRTWGENSNAVFINTETNGYINTDGWAEMSSGQGASAVFKEYGNTSGGAAFATAGSFCPAANQTLEAVQDYIDTDTVSIVNTVLGGWKPSRYSDESDKKDPEEPEPDTETIAKPAADPVPGAVKKGTAVTLICETQGADIYYTTDGSAPTTASAKYTEPIAIDKALTIKAVAVKGEKTSEAAEFAYTVTDESSDTPGDPSGDPEKEKDSVVITLNECEIVVPSIIRKKDTDPIKPETYVTYKGYRFAEGIDYSVSEPSEPDKDGFCTITLEGLERENTGRTQEAYKIAKTPRAEKFKVVSASVGNSGNVVDMSKADIRLDKASMNQYYNGTGRTVSLIFKDARLKELYDSGKINCAYKNNINAGRATVSITVKPDSGEEVIYAGAKELSFNIKKAALNTKQDIATAVVSYNKDASEAQSYAGDISAIGLKVMTDGGISLAEDADYTVVYKTNSRAEVTFSVKGIGNNLTGSYTDKFKIKPLNLSKVEVNTKDTAYSPKGARLSEIEITTESGIKATLKEGSDYTAKYDYGRSRNKRNPGSSIKVTIKGKGVCAGTKTFSVDIKKADFSKNDIIAPEVVVDADRLAAAGSRADRIQRVYEAAMKVSDSSGAKLKAGRDYTVNVINGTDIEIKPAGVNADYYTGTKTVKYRVAGNLAKQRKLVFGRYTAFAYDGRNPVQLTQKDIDTINEEQGTAYVLGTNIRIVPGSYRNNARRGTAQVTLEGIGGYYGTKVLKFKIVTD